MPLVNGHWVLLYPVFIILFKGHDLLKWLYCSVYFQFFNILGAHLPSTASCVGRPQDLEFIT